MDVWNRWFYNTRLVAAGRFVMERGNTKQEILEASLELFSVQGFEATSISQIANAVGVRKASLYSHFGSKQAILDTLVKQVLQQYGEHSVLAHGNWEKDAGNLPLTADEAVRMVQGQIRYILHDPGIRRARKMLVIEQFQNPKLAKLQTKQNYSDVLWVSLGGDIEIPSERINAAVTPALAGGYAVTLQRLKILAHALPRTRGKP